MITAWREKLMTDQCWLLIDHWSLMIDDWCLMIDDWWLMTDIIWNVRDSLPQGGSPLGQTIWGPFHITSVINHQSSIISHQSSIINHQSSMINDQSIVSTHQSSIYSRHAVITFFLTCMQRRVDTVWEPSDTTKLIRKGSLGSHGAQVLGIPGAWVPGIPGARIPGIPGAREEIGWFGRRVLMNKGV